MSLEEIAANAAYLVGRPGVSVIGEEVWFEELAPCYFERTNGSEPTTAQRLAEITEGLGRIGLTAVDSFANGYRCAGRIAEK